MKKPPSIPNKSISINFIFDLNTHFFDVSIAVSKGLKNLFIKILLYYFLLVKI
jgi:hypothetical protein